MIALLLASYALGPVDEIEDMANRLYDSDVKRDQIIGQAFKE